MPGDTNPIRDIASIINDQQQISLKELEDTASTLGISKEGIRIALSELEKTKIIASRSSGGIVTYYMLEKSSPLNKVIIVEDDKNISKLMSISIGQGLETRQIYDGGRPCRP